MCEQFHWFIVFSKRDHYMYIDMCVLEHWIVEKEYELRIRRNDMSVC